MGGQRHGAREHPLRARALGPHPVPLHRLRQAEEVQREARLQAEGGSQD